MTGYNFLRSVNEATAPAEQAEVYIEVGALPAQVAPLRVVTADLAARADFDLDAVADLRMAVDEACSTLATLAVPDARMQCLVRVDTERITVTVRIPSPRIAVIAQDTFGWRVLATLADKVEILGNDVADPPSLGIRLVKERQVGVA